MGLFHSRCSFPAWPVLLVLLGCAALAGQCQQAACRHCALEAGVHYGRVIPIHPDYPEIKNNSDAYELIFLQKTTGRQEWQRLLGYPWWGVTARFTRFGNEAQLGQAFALLPHLTFEKTGASRLQGYLRLGLGLAWLNRPYDFETNPENIVIGSRLNNVAAASAGLHWRLLPRWWAKLAFAATHYSNAKFKEPNLGINIPVVRLGLLYVPSGLPEKPLPGEKPQWDKRVRLNLRLGLGLNERGPANGPKYPIYVVAAYGSRLFAPFYKFQLGLEAFHDAGVRDFLDKQEIGVAGQRGWDATRLAVSMGHELLIGHGGIYLHQPVFRQSLISTRLGLQCYLFDPHEQQRHQVFIGTYVKSEFGVAAFWEVGLGYVW